MDDCQKNRGSAALAEIATRDGERLSPGLRLTALAALASLVLATLQTAEAQTNPSAPQPFIEEQRQQERTAHCANNKSSALMPGSPAQPPLPQPVCRHQKPLASPSRTSCWKGKWHTNSNGCCPLRP